MGNSSLSLCDTEDFLADSDVAGIGVLLSFALGAVCTLVAIIFGYLTDTLPETTLNRFDYYILAHSNRWLRSISTRSKTSAHALLARLRLVAPRPLDNMPQDGQRDGELPADDISAIRRRREGFERFALALSDQQLVTGLAVMIAGYSKAYSMSIHHFNIVACLAWFSSVTHLATLGALRTYLFKHPTIRNWRVIAMVLLLAMVLVANLPRWTYKSHWVPVSCFYRDMDIPIKFPSLFRLLPPLLFLLVMYTERIARLYSLDMDWNISDYFIEKFVRVLSGRDFLEHGDESVANYSELRYPNHLSASIAIRAKRERIRFSHFETDLKSSRLRIKSYVIATIFMAREINIGFISQLTVSLFALTYGFAQTMMFRTTKNIEGKENVMGFGQLVPLLFLLLPVLTVCELYFEDHDDEALERMKINIIPCVGNRAMTAVMSGSSTQIAALISGIGLVSPNKEECRTVPPDCGQGRSVILDCTCAEGEEHIHEPTTLEELLCRLDSEMKNCGEDDGSTSDDSEGQELYRAERVDNNIALQETHGYKPGGNGPSPSVVDDTEDLEIGGTRTNVAKAQSNMTEPSSSIMNPFIFLKSYQRAQTSFKAVAHKVKDPPRGWGSDIPYLGIALWVFCFQVVFRMMFAFALVGGFEAIGVFSAIVLLSLFFIVSFFIFVGKVWQTMIKINQEARKAS